MHFKIFNISLLTVLLSACAPTPDTSQSHIIGTTLTSVTSMTDEYGVGETQVVMYDSTVARVHQFDLERKILGRSFATRWPGGPHYVLYAPNGNYIFEFTRKHVTLFNKAGHIQEPLTFVGTPTSASFRPSMGFLVIYDDLHTVGIIKLDGDGNVLGKWKSGPVFTGDLTISSGDINVDGKLVLALSDNSIRVVDMNQTITAGAWVTVNQFATALTDIKWIGPVRDVATEVLLLSKDKITIMDMVSGLVMGTEITIATDQIVTKTSKSHDPHFLLTSNTTRIDLIYAQGSQLHAKPNYNILKNALSSRLSLQHNTWTVVDSTLSSFVVEFFGLVPYIIYDDPNATKRARTLKRFSVSSLQSTHETPLPDDAEVVISENQMFELYPSPLGMARHKGIDGEKKAEFPNFNKPWMH